MNGKYINCLFVLWYQNSIISSALMSITHLQANIVNLRCGIGIAMYTCTLFTTGERGDNQRSSIEEGHKIQ
jgi:hypothetical protein